MYPLPETQLLDFLKTQDDFLDDILQHFDMSAVMDFITRLATAGEDRQFLHVRFLSDRWILCGLSTYAEKSYENGAFIHTLILDK